MKGNPDGLRLVRLDVATMQALLAGDRRRASARCGVPLTAYLVDHAWLWRIRVDQVLADPASADWIARAAFDERLGEVVGHVGFHGPPDPTGMVEVAYAVDPVHRRRGIATRMLSAALSWAATDPRVTRVRASVSPGNIASLATLRHHPFELVGDQWDEEDGRELLWELWLDRGDLSRPGGAPGR